MVLVSAPQNKHWAVLKQCIITIIKKVLRSSYMLSHNIITAIAILGSRINYIHARMEPRPMPSQVIHLNGGGGYYDNKDCAMHAGINNISTDGQPVYLMKNTIATGEKNEDMIQCMQRINTDVKKANAAASQVFNQIISTSKPEKTCVQSFDKKANSCYLSKYINTMINHPVWNIVLHNNVVEIYYGKVLRKLLILELFSYRIVKKALHCITHFKYSNALAKHNAFGTTLEITGDISNAKKNDCYPCGMSKSSDNVDGKGHDCNTCNPLAQLMGIESIVDANLDESPRPSEYKKKEVSPPGKNSKKSSSSH